MVAARNWFGGIKIKHIQKPITVSRALPSILPDLDWKEHSGPNGEEGFKFHVTLSDLYEGPPQAVHGGYIAGLFDELLGAVQSLSKTELATRQIRN